MVSLIVVFKVAFEDDTAVVSVSPSKSDNWLLEDSIKVTFSKKLSNLVLAEEKLVKFSNSV